MATSQTLPLQLKQKEKSKIDGDTRDDVGDGDGSDVLNASHNIVNISNKVVAIGTTAKIPLTLQIGDCTANSGPRTKDEFRKLQLSFAALIAKHKHSPFYVEFVQELIRKLCEPMSAANIREIKFTVRNLHMQQIKLEQQHKRNMRQQHHHQLQQQQQHEQRQQEHQLQLIGKCKSKGKMRSKNRHLDDMDYDYRKYSDFYDFFDDYYY